MVLGGRRQGIPQTNLQSVALAVVAMGASGVLKDWHPWPSDQCLSEIHIERQFGQYRGQSQSGELSARSYFCASARAVRCQASRRTSKTAKTGEAAPNTNDGLLSEEELLDFDFQILLVCSFNYV